METIQINTATLFEKGHITGNTIYKDFCRSGYITISFRINGRKLQAFDVNGYEITSRGTYVKNPKNPIEEQNNKMWLERFYNDLEMTNQQILISKFFI